MFISLNKIFYVSATEFLSLFILSFYSDFTIYCSAFTCHNGMASFGNILLVVAYYSLMLRKYFFLGFPAVEVFTSISDFFLFFRDAILWNKLELRIFFYHFTSFFFSWNVLFSPWFSVAIGLLTRPKNNKHIWNADYLIWRKLHVLVFDLVRSLTSFGLTYNAIFAIETNFTI